MPETSSTSAGPRPHRGIVIALVVLATLIGTVASFAVWSKRQLLETDEWTQTSSRLLEDEQIQNAVADFMVEALFSNVDVSGGLAQALPPRLQPLAGPAAGGLRQLADRVAPQLLQQPRVQALWEDANRAAHERLLAVVEDRAPALSESGDDVYLDIGVMVHQLGDALGIAAVSRIPEDAVQIRLMRADQLEAAQEGVDLMKTIAYVLSALTLALLALAVYLARGWRRVALRSAGVSFLAIGVLVLVVRSVAGNFVVDSLATTAAVEPAADSAWSIGTSLLGDLGVAMIGYGVVILLAAWLAGPGVVATACRRAITPFVRERTVLYPILLAIVLLVVWWSPTEGTRRLVPSLVLIALLVIGAEALRRQVVREFPERTMADVGESWRGRWEAVLARARGVTLPRAGGTQTAPAEDRISQLERLAELHRAGVLDEEELAEEKARVRAAA